MVTADQIKDHIIRHLQWDSSLKGSRINVDYVGRTAILTGTVPDLTAHAMAQRHALSIPGVDAVDNRLLVEYDHDHPNKTDLEIREDIKSVLGCTAGLGGSQIEVSVTDGIVTLDGYVDAFWKKSRAEDMAASVEGILSIQNNLKVKAAEVAPDRSIKRDIINALTRMQVKGLEHLDIQVENGKVTLSGSVPTWTTSFNVEDTARYTSGVVDVKNNLTVE